MFDLNPLEGDTSLKMEVMLCYVDINTDARSLTGSRKYRVRSGRRLPTTTIATIEVKTRLTREETTKLKDLSTLLSLAATYGLSIQH